MTLHQPMLMMPTSFIKTEIHVFINLLLITALFGLMEAMIISSFGRILGEETTVALICPPRQEVRILVVSTCARRRTWALAARLTILNKAGQTLWNSASQNWC